LGFRDNDGRHAHRVGCSAELFHTANGTALADLMINGHRETWPVRSLRFRSWLRRGYYDATGGAPSPAQLKSALDTVEARAQFDAPRRAVYLRVAEQDGRLYLDLADEQWRAVDVGPDGWRIVASPPVRFRSAAGMLPLPVPVKGGSINDLAPFLNLPGRSEFVLVVAWLLAALRHGGPYPLLAVFGEQGSAKTVLSKVLRALIDPNAAPVRTMPREERDLFIAASNTCSPSTTCPTFPLTPPMRCVDWRAAAALPSDNSIPTPMKYCSRPRARRFSMALRTSSPGQTWRTERSF
jgi:hypothetical protein